MDFKLEVISFDIESCATIQDNGAHRIELCANPAEGGTTPSYGFIKKARENVSIGLFPIIRPRGGDFLYSDDEFEVMKNDVQLCKELGCNGVVVGLLNKDGSIQIERTSLLRELAYPMEFTFHRAFDYCLDPFVALGQLIEIGCQRILTSGQQLTAIRGLELIEQLVKAANGNIIIMPGSGVRKENIKELADKTGAVEFHSSLRSLSESKMEFMHPSFTSTAESFIHTSVKGEDVKSILESLHN